jgi:hypothetical protein
VGVEVYFNSLLRPAIAYGEAPALINRLAYSHPTMLGLMMLGISLIGATAGFRIALAVME